MRTLGDKIQPSLFFRVAMVASLLILTLSSSHAQTLVNVNFAAYDLVKTGFAGTGQGANDFWNTYTAPYQALAGLSNLRTAAGTGTSIGLTVHNGAGHWNFSHPDLMYSTYCYSQDQGDITMTVTNLPSGKWDIYLYGHGGANEANTLFQVLVDGYDYGIQPTTTNASYALTNFVEGAQYVVFRNVAVTNGGAPLTVKAHPGLSGDAHLNGLQMALAASPMILEQPTNRTVLVGEAATFAVSATGAPPLQYQWLRNGTALTGAISSSLVLTNAQLADAGSYSVVVSNASGSTTSSNAVLIVSPSQPLTLFNVNFAAYDLAKVGYAATGQSANDLWNNYTAPYATLAGVTNLQTADGTTTSVGLTVQNGPGHWNFAHPDLMYSTYCYTVTGPIDVTVTNLSSGRYDVYLYGHGGSANANTIFQLLVGGHDYGYQSTTTDASYALTNWVEGSQYVVFHNIVITNGAAPLNIRAYGGLAGYSHLNGLQIAALSDETPPTIVTQPSGQVGYWGKSASMQVTVKGASPLFYQWYFNEFPISWGTNATLTIPSLELYDAGTYQVKVSNNFGSITSTPTLLVVNPAGIALGMYPGLTIEGTVGRNFGIQFTTDVSATNTWTTLTNITLTQPVQLWMDTSVNVSDGTQPRRYYRIVAIP